MEIEIEKKSLISENDYLSIIDKYNTEPQLQINYYFETKDNYFKNNNSALRIRNKHNKYTLTLKIKAQSQNHEYNYNADNTTLSSMIKGEIPDNIKQLISTTAKIHNIATIKTERAKVIYQNHVVEIDKSTFNKKIDYEIEVESTTPLKAKATLENFLKDNNISYQKSKAKIARYFDYNKEII